MRKIYWLFFFLIAVALYYYNSTEPRRAVSEFADYLVAGDFINASYYVSCSDGYLSEEAIVTREMILQDHIKQGWAEKMAVLKTSGLYIAELNLIDFQKVGHEKYLAIAEVTIAESGRKRKEKTELHLSLMPPAQWNVWKLSIENTEENNSIHLLEQALNCFLQVEILQFCKTFSPLGVGNF